MSAAGVHANGTASRLDAVAGLAFHLTIFDNHAAGRKREESCTLATLADRVRKVSAPEKKALPWLKLARFGDQKTDKGSLRHDSNVLAITGVEADYDGEKVTVAEVVERLEKAGVLAMVYTSPSHTEATPRWRVLCPTSSELPPQRRERLVGRLNGLLGGILAGESFTLSQAYYFGSVRRSPAHQVHLIDGIPLDEHDELDETWRGRPQTHNTRPDKPGGPAAGKTNEAALLADIVTGAGYHAACVRLLGVWALAGVALTVARARLLAAFDAVPDADRGDRWHQRRADVDRCLLDIYAKEGKRKDRGERKAKPAGSSTDQSWGERLIRGESGQPAACEANVRLVLETESRWNGVLGFDEFASEMVLLRPPPWVEGAARGGWKPRPITDAGVIETAMWMQHEARIMVTVPKALNAVAAACRAHPFHPVRDYLDSLKWDGKPRIERWLTYYVGAEDNEYHRAVGARWLIGATARIYRPGCKLDTALILEGPQRLRKSTTAAVLGGAWFTDTPQDLRSKDAMEELQGVWIVELAELTALGTAGTDRIKAFLSSSTDRFRPSYGRLVQSHPRQCAFLGTVNPDGGGYLKDPTGGSRFWPVRCGTSIDIDALRHDRDQLWAEAVHQFRAKAQWWIDDADLAALAGDQQAERYAEDAREPLIASYLAGKNSVSVSEVIENAMPLSDRDRWGQKTQNLVARTLIRLGWSRKRIGPRTDRAWRYFAPGEE